MPKILTQQLVQEFLHYDPDTGIFIWKKNPQSGTRRAGCVAGFKRADGYWSVKIEGGNYFAHRVAWLHITGEWPTSEIDHKDCDPSNNRWDNLRLADRSTNIANGSVRANNRSGLKGAFWVGKGQKWRSQIHVRGRFFHLGYFATPEEANAAYAEAAKKHFGEFARS